MSVKSFLSSSLRRLNLLAFADSLRYKYHQFKYRHINRKFKKEHKDILLPPDYFIYETYRLNFYEYYYDGQATAKEIVEVLTVKTGVFSSRGVKLLDWGCGPGRITRHLPALLPGAALFATDYNKEYIDWCNRSIKRIDFSVNGVNPPLAYTDSFFEVVIGLSVFTHLSEENHQAWINELYRIIKPGGFAYITTQGEAYRQKLTESEQAVFDNGCLVVRANIKEGNRLFSAFQPPAYIRKLIENKFSVVDHLPGDAEKADPSQDSWILIRQGSV